MTAGYIWLTKVVTLQKLMDHLPLQWWFWCAHGLESIFPCKCGYLSPLIIDAMITACSKHATRKRKGVDSSLFNPWWERMRVVFGNRENRPTTLVLHMHYRQNSSKMWQEFHIIHINGICIEIREKLAASNEEKFWFWNLPLFALIFPKLHQ